MSDIEIKFHENYFIYGLFIAWIIIYLNLPKPEIYEFEKKQNNNCANCMQI